MKKILTGFLIGSLFGTSVTFASTHFFTDIPANVWFSSAVESLSNKGIISGYPNGTFGPTNNVNRAELAVILDRLLEYVETGQVSSQGSDSYTYTNREWKYQVNYPTGWDYKESFGTNYFQFAGFNPEENTSEDYQVLVGVLSTEEQMYIDSIDDGPLTFIEEYKQVINGITWSTFIYEHESTQEKHHLYMKKGGQSQTTYIILGKEGSVEGFVNSFSIQ